MRIKYLARSLVMSTLAVGIVIGLTSCGGGNTSRNILDSFNLFQSSQYMDHHVCMTCHPEIYGQWSLSMHNNSYKDPLFQKVYELAVKDTGGDKTIEAFCIACHSPIGFTSGEIPPSDGSKLSEIAKDGVQCDFCHTVKKSHGIGNFAAINKPGDIKWGPFDDAISSFHQTEFSELHTKAEFCGMCHNVSHPNNNLPLENTYTEWKEGPYSAQGIQCQDCHMTPGPGVTKPNPGKAAIMGPEREHIYTHSVVGGNVAVAKLLGSVERASLAEERLQAAASLEIIPPKAMNPGEKAILKIKVTNQGAGHYLPTGLTETRQMWLYVKIKDREGKTIFSSGELDMHGEIKEGSIIYNTVVADSSGKPTHKVWRAEKIIYDHRIPPKESVTETYSFKVPNSSPGPFTVETVLKYRSAPQEFVDELLGKDSFELPITDMASASAKIE